MVTYTSITQYMESATSLQAKIAKIDALIPMLYDSMVTVALNEGIEEYTMDNGQTKLHIKYKNVESVQKSIDALQFTRDKLVAMLNRNSHGSIVRLVDQSNLNGNNFNGR